MCCSVCGKKIKALGYCNRHYLQFKKYGKIISNTNRTIDDLNEIIIYDNYAEIILYNNKSIEVAKTKVDLENIEILKNFKWRINKKKNKIYVITGRNENQKYLHSMILNTNNEIDHINGDSLDNRLCNLRECSHMENCKNILTRKDNKLGIIGICYYHGWYKCEIQHNKIRIYLGQYKDINKAIYSRIVAEEYLFKEFAKINKIEYILTEKEKKEVYNKTLNKINLRIDKILGN